MIIDGPPARTHSSARRRRAVPGRLDHRRRPQARAPRSQLDRPWATATPGWRRAAARRPPRRRSKIYNRGISGNKVPDLDAAGEGLPRPEARRAEHPHRRERHLAQAQRQIQRHVEELREGLPTLSIKRTKEALPESKLVICEPFVLKSGAVNDTWFPEFDGYRAVATRVAEKARRNLRAVPGDVRRGVKVAPPDRWAGDGVHPSPDGAALMAHTWAPRRRRRRGVSVHLFITSEPGLPDAGALEALNHWPKKTTRRGRDAPARSMLSQKITQTDGASRRRTTWTRPPSPPPARSPPSCRRASTIT